jgi:hypothetical protein
VYDCWDVADLPGCPPVSSNEPIGPGSSVNTETEPIRLVMAAAFAYTAKLPMYVFHSEAGRVRQDPLPGYAGNRPLPPGSAPAAAGSGELAGGTTARRRGLPSQPFAGGKANRYWPDVDSGADGCVRNIGSRKGKRFVCVPIGIQPGGLTLEARTSSVRFSVYDPLTGKRVLSAACRAGERCVLAQGPGAYIILGTEQPAPPSRPVSAR